MVQPSLKEGSFLLEDGYSKLPNKILFDSGVPHSAKSVYMVISSLCATEGKCWASNAYIGKKLSMSERQISRAIRILAKYLIIENPYNERRVICLDKNVYPPRQKCRGGLDKNVQHINTNNKYKYIKGKDSMTSKEYLEKYHNPKPTVLPDWVVDERKEKTS